MLLPVLFIGVVHLIAFIYVKTSEIEVSHSHYRLNHLACGNDPGLKLTVLQQRSQ